MGPHFGPYVSKMAPQEGLIRGGDRTQVSPGSLWLSVGADGRNGETLEEDTREQGGQTEVGAVEEGERVYVKVLLTRSAQGVGSGCDRRRKRITSPEHP